MDSFTDKIQLLAIYNQRLQYEYIIMLQNLKEFVCKFVEKQNKGSFPHLYIVDKQTGPYRKIQDAINAAEPNSLIKISQGFYEENLYITKPLTIEPKSIGENTQKVGVVLLVQSGTGIHIKLPYSQSRVNISGIKIGHTGNSSQLHMQLIKHQHILNIFEDHEKETDSLQHELVNRIAFNKVENMIMMVEVGKVNVQMCVFSLKYLVKSCRILIPAICIDKQGELNITDSQIKGNQSKDTIGVICKLGIINMKNCIISDHREGGILVWGVRQNPSKLIRNKIQGNSIGIHATGQEFKLKICQNKIMKNKTGVKIGIASQVQISRNYICENTNGIQVYSSFPLIYLNKIDKNKQNGIITHSYKNMLCIAKIKRNVSITGNSYNGILIEGQNNRTKITENYLIGFNTLCGIRVAKESFPLILKNKIYKNHQQGILITQDANAIIQRNSISHNIQCNIALGGLVSHNTLIVENSINGSPGPGIIMIEGLCNISRNDITNNLQGIKLIQSSGRIRRNYIANNDNDGINCQGQCNPTIVQNLITRNQSIGIFFREQGGLMSDSVIYSNIVVSNEINVGLQFKNEIIANNLSSSNTIQGKIQQPSTLICNIM